MVGSDCLPSTGGLAAQHQGFDGGDGGGEAAGAEAAGAGRGDEDVILDADATDPVFNLCHPSKRSQFYWHIFVSHNFCS